MHESPEEIRELQALLDRSYASGGGHLLSIHGNEGWRLSAEQVVERLQGMVILNLATVSSKAAPYVSPVDGFLFRGRFWFGSSPDSLRAKHIRRNPNVSASHTVGEELAVTVHGRAIEVDKSTDRALGFKGVLVTIYGEEGIEEFWTGGALYWEIESRRMFALAPQV